MKTVKAIIRPHRYEKIAEALAAIGVVGVTATNCMEQDRQKGHWEIYRGDAYEQKRAPGSS